MVGEVSASWRAILLVHVCGGKVYLAPLARSWYGHRGMVSEVSTDAGAEAHLLSCQGLAAGLACAVFLVRDAPFDHGLAYCFV